MDKKLRSLAAAAIFRLVRMFLILAVVVAPFQAARADPVVLYVAPSGLGSGDCSDWVNACTLQDALATAVSSDEIWVKAGVHKPTIDPGNRDAAFAVPNGVAAYGGFAGNETSRDQRNWQAYLTILSGDIDNNDTNTDGNFIAETPADIQGNNSYHVVRNSGVDASAVLDGFIVTAGKYAETYPGAGIYNYSASPTLSNLVIIGNAAHDGGGMHNNDNSSPTLTNVSFINNSAVSSGGGLKNYWECNPTLTNVTFLGNTAGYTGGGMDNYISGSTLTNVVFRGNSASGAAGVAVWYATVTLNNVTFSDNVATGGNPGGIYAHYSIVNLRNSILWGDQSLNGMETSIYVDQYGDLQGAFNIAYSDIQGCGGSSAWVGGHCGANLGGNIDADPLFLEAAEGNLRLQPTSPAIDAANNSAVPASVTTDLDGGTRFLDIAGVPDTGAGTPPVVDMGAYEAHPDASAPSVVIISRLDPNPTTAAVVRYLVEFSEPVGGVSTGDFGLNVSGLTDAAVIGVSGGPTWYTVFVSTGTGTGSLWLDVPVSATITDLALNPLSGLPYTDMDSYVVDKTAPTILSVTRAGDSPTNAASVDYIVTFSEVVSGIGPDDFSLTASGVGGASVSGVSGGPTNFTVTVFTGTGDGDLRLDIPGTATISDVAGNPLGGLPYTSGETYAVDKTAPSVVSIAQASTNPVYDDRVDFTVTFSEEVAGLGSGDFSLFTTGSVAGAIVTDVSGSGFSYTVSVDLGVGGGTLRLDIPGAAMVADPAGNALSGLPYEEGEAYTILYRVYLPLVVNLMP